MQNKPTPAAAAAYTPTQASFATQGGVSPLRKPLGGTSSPKPVTGVSAITAGKATLLGGA